MTLFPEHSSSEICPIVDEGSPLVTSGLALSLCLGALMNLGGSLSRGDSLVSGSESSRVQCSLEANADPDWALAQGRSLLALPHPYPSLAGPGGSGGSA